MWGEEIESAGAVRAKCRPSMKQQLHDFTEKSNEKLCKHQLDDKIS